MPVQDVVHPRPAHGAGGLLGVLLVVAAAALFGINGTVSKLVLQSGLSSLRLVEIRCLGAAVVFLLIAVCRDPRSIRVGARELGFLAVYGIIGLAMVQWLYLVAIVRMPVSISLLIEFTAPLLTALYVRFVRRGQVRARVWAALVLVLGGLTMVCQVWAGLTLDGLGLLAASGAAVALAAYYLLGEHGLGSRDPFSLAAWSFAAAALFWGVLQPWWTFPFERLDDPISISTHVGSAALSVPMGWLLVYTVVFGTVAPFGLTLLGLRLIGATRVSLAASAEPALAGVVAFLVLGEVLTGWQSAGAVLVLAGIVLAETARPPAEEHPATLGLTG